MPINYLETFPSQFYMICEQIGTGQRIEVTVECESPNRAKHMRMLFYRFRNLLRVAYSKNAEPRPGIRMLAEAVVVRVTDSTITFLYRDAGRDALAIERAFEAAV